MKPQFSFPYPVFRRNIRNDVVQFFSSHHHHHHHHHPRKKFVKIDVANIFIFTFLRQKLLRTLREPLLKKLSFQSGMFFSLAFHFYFLKVKTHACVRWILCQLVKKTAWKRLWMEWSMKFASCFYFPSQVVQIPEGKEECRSLGFYSCILSVTFWAVFDWT